jgi:outer membrane immunogenic protein
MKKAIVAGVSVVALLAPGQANAADMYRAPEPFVGGGYKDPPAASWTGFYVGVNGGYAWNATNQDVVATNAAHVTATFAGAQPEGGFGGGQIGYNWQGIWHPHLVLGVEADIQGAGIEDTRRSGPSGGVIADAKSNTDWFGTVRGRIGYAFDRTLIYGTGGFAFGNVDSRLDAVVPSVGTIARHNDTQTGYAAGGGLEYKINSTWSVKGEYQYINLGDEKLAGVGVGATFGITTKDITTDFHTVRAGLNYKFGSSYEPLK